MENKIKSRTAILITSVACCMLLFAQCRDDKLEMLHEFSDSLNEDGIQEVETGLTFNWSEVVSEDTLKLNYMWWNQVDADFSPQTQERLRLQFLDLLKEDPDVEPIKEINTIFLYSFGNITKSQDAEITEFTIGPKEYNEPEEKEEE